MVDKKHLIERATLIGESASEDGTWKVRLISEGKGSSGVYTASLLENHHHAFDNVLSFKNHPTGWDGPESRDFTMIAGQVVGETWVESDERGLKAVYGNYLPDPEHKDKIERYKDKLGLSIFIEGSGYWDDSDEFIVDWFNPADPYASLDVVIAPGARGKFMESMRSFYESATPGSRQATTTAVEEKKDNEMLDEKAIGEAIASALAPLAAKLDTLVATKENAEAVEAQAKADAEAVAKAVEAYDAAVKAVDEADLLKPQAEALLEAAKRGEDITAAIESAKAIKEAAVEAARVSEGAGSGGRDFGKTETRYGAWS
jgi:hypothetical protein